MREYVGNGKVNAVNNNCSNESVIVLSAVCVKTSVNCRYIDTLEMKTNFTAIASGTRPLFLLTRRNKTWPLSGN